MKAIKIRDGFVAATFSVSELESFGYLGGKPSRETVYALAERAFSEICEYPPDITAQVFLAEDELLLLAQKRFATNFIPN